MVVDFGVNAARERKLTAQGDGNKGPEVVVHECEDVKWKRYVCDTVSPGSQKPGSEQRKKYRLCICRH